ncbi:MAG: RNA-binding protein [Candidatus Aenigmarchaeota archaeon]|nr:RNA-binding protein [Candidatus Aenigmarchaeota archaeon]
MQQRPLDVLGSSENKRILIQIKKGDKIVGVLKAFDSHLNIWLDDAEVKSPDGQVEKLGTVLVRGDNIILISPSP